MKPRNGLISTVLLMTVGILRDYHQRRWAMFFIVLAALFSVFIGSVFLMDWLKERPLAFLVYWAMSGWLTITAALLAMFDLLLVRRSGVEAKRQLRKTMFVEAESGQDVPSRKEKSDVKNS